MTGAEHTQTEAVEPEHQPLRGSRVNKGLVIVNTGKGKGKTTAALGLMLRAWGRNMNVQMYQFLKPPTANFGEHRAAKKLGIPIIALGDGFTWRSKDTDQSAELALAQWERAKTAILAGEHDVILLDEFTYPLHYGWLPVADVIHVLKQRKEMLHVVITGRYAPQELIDYADLVTEMTLVKHPYREQGIKAQPGSNSDGRGRRGGKPSKVATNESTPRRPARPRGRRARSRRRAAVAQ